MNRRNNCRSALSSFVAWVNDSSDLINELEEAKPGLLAKAEKILADLPRNARHYSTLSAGEARQWLIDNDPEAAEFWRSSKATDGELIAAVGLNLREFGDEDDLTADRLKCDCAFVHNGTCAHHLGEYPSGARGRQ